MLAITNNLPWITGIIISIIAIIFPATAPLFLIILFIISVFLTIGDMTTPTRG